MIGRWRALYLIVLLAALLAGHAQTSSPQAAVKSDYSLEAAVVEEMSIKLTFENDGNSTREQTSRVRVQTDAGLQQWGLISFQFQSATQVVEIDHVRVHKTDGTTLVTPPDNVQDLDSEITRSAPFYSDLREKHVAVKGLGKGDILEYKARWRSTKTLTPGQFYFQYNFHNDGIVLNERLEVRVPRERAVKIKGPQTTQSITTEGDARIYAWTYSKLKSDNETGHEQKKQIELALGRLPPPDVQISSFQSWEEVGQWYWRLQKERVEPTAAIRAKAAELTKGLTDDASKLQALYSFVSLQYRYIGIAFGIGRYQPHAADDILTNNYGDCKDKQTLLASLLQASGITLHPALISSTWQLDPDVPSPAQFDHVIGYLPQGKTAIWLDTTPEVAPVGYLVPRLRDKQALVMSGEKSIQLVTTPANLPCSSTETFSIDGKLGDDGTLEAKVEDRSRGDAEVHLRAAFRQTPQAQWKDLVQRISYALGYAGTVKDVDASAPEVNTEPFRISYSYNRKDYPDWSTRQFTVPGLPFYMPAAKDDTKDAVWLGPPLETISNSRVALPKDYKPVVPSDVDLKYDFAEYHASYSADKGALVAKRRLLIKLHDVPVSELEDYRNFVKNLNNDVNQYVTTIPSNAEVVTGPPTLTTDPHTFVSDPRQMPNSKSTDANRLENDAHRAVRLGDRAAAIRAYKQALEADPKFARAWIGLAFEYVATRQMDSVLDALQKSVASDPNQTLPRRMYAFWLTQLHQPGAAIDVLRQLLKIDPSDPEANSRLGSLLVQQKDYSEAAPYLETAAKSDPSPWLQYSLGATYLHNGETEKGMAVLEKMVQTNPTAESWNNVAYQLADANVALPKALDYSQHAVEEQEKESRGVDLANLIPEDLACTRKIGSYWDTLGWVHFRSGNLAQAESFLNAAWLLSQDPVEADHLGRVYEQQKKTAKAIHMYRLAVATSQGKVARD
jgi:tetratricopeptide (TPR) repeat protein